MAVPLRILMLEDNPSDAVLAQFELEEAGLIFTSKVVMTEEDFVRELQEYCPDLILSDYDLPKYNGALALAEAKKRCPDTPFILVTGAVSEDRAIEILTQGAKDYVLKTRLQQRLVPAVRRALAEAEEHQARKQAEAELREAHRNLEEKVKIRTAELETEMVARKKTDEALRESERQFRTLANSIPQLAWIARADGFIFWYNQRWYDYTGTTPEQMEGWGWQSVHDPKVLPAVMERWKTAIATGNPFDMEFPLLGADKVFRPFLTRVLPLRNEQGRVIQWFGTNTDLSERKQAEEELALNEREFRLLAESMPQIVWTTRVDGWNTYFNQKWVDYTGLTLEESYGHGWNKPFHPDDQQRAWDAWQNAVLNNAPYLLQCRLRRADGIYRWWLIHGVPVLDENGKIIKWYGTCTDINDLKQTEEAMLQSQNQFNLLIKNIRSGVALIDDTGTFIVVNPSFLRMFGLKDDETINNVNDKNWNDWQVFESDGTLLHVDEHPVRKAAITGKPVKNKLVCVRLPSGGDLIWMLISADLVFRPDGSIQSTICTYHDITEIKRTEDALQRALADSEQNRVFLEAVVSAQVDVVIIYNSQMNVQRANPAFIEIYGFDPIGLHVTDIMQRVSCRSLDGQPPILGEQPTPQALKGEKVIGLRFTVTRADGTDGTVEVSSGPIQQGDNIIGAVTVWHDITEQEKSEESLHESEERFRRAFDSSAVAMTLTASDGKLLRVNPAMCELVGYSAAELTGHNFIAMTHPDDLPVNLEGLKALASGERSNFRMEKRYLHKDGHVIWVDMSTSAMRGVQGKPDYLITYAQDITERKRAEEALREEIAERKNREKEQEKLNRTLRALSKSNQAMMRATDENAYMEEICKVVVEDCGHAMVWIGFAEEDENKTVRPVAYSGFEQGYIDTLNITWANTERGHGPTGAAIRTGEISTCRNMLTDPLFIPWREEALKRGYASSIVLPLTSDGKVFGALTIYSKESDPFTEEEVKLLTELASDLSYGIMVIRSRVARAKAEETLNERTSQLENLNKELESFSYSVSHDLRAPLRAIEGYSRMILKKAWDRFDEDTRHKFATISSSAKKMNQLIDDLLNFSRLVSLDLAVSKIDMEYLVRETQEELQRDNPDRVMTFKIGNLPQCVGDRNLMKQVYINLLSNAVKFTRLRDTALIEIGGYLEGNECIFFVKDNGAGFDMAYHDKLFGVFQRLHGSDDYEGTGIGLALVKRIINRHGGRIWADGEVDKGATIYFTLPTGQE